MTQEAVEVRCVQCGTLNRVPVQSSKGRMAVCGSCKAPLAVEATPVTVTDANFSDTVAGSAIPVLLDLWAPWCGPCRMIAPVLEQLAREWAGRVRIGKLNVDENPRTAARFGVQSIPTMIVLQKGKEVDRMVGALPKSAIVEHLESLLRS